MIAVLFSTALFAQTDSTAVYGGLTALVAGLEAKYTWVATVIAAIAILSEILALIPAKYIPANGIVDAVVKAIKWISNFKK